MFENRNEHTTCSVFDKINLVIVKANAILVKHEKCIVIYCIFLSHTIDWVWQQQKPEEFKAHSMLIKNLQTLIICHKRTKEYKHEEVSPSDLLPNLNITKK